MSQKVITIADFSASPDFSDLSQRVGVTTSSLDDNNIRRAMDQLIAADNVAVLDVDDDVKTAIPLDFGADIPDDDGTYVTILPVYMRVRRVVKGGKKAAAPLQFGGTSLSDSDDGLIS